MPVEATPPAGRTGAASLARTVQPFTRPDRKKAIRQIINTLVPFFALWVLMVVMVQQGYPYWSVLAISVVAAAFQVRIFILFHDCCHGSFFGTPRANWILGYVTGILTFTPFEQWRRSHAMHHDTVGDLDRRGVGDIWTLTAEEFENLVAENQQAARGRINELFTRYGIDVVVSDLGQLYAPAGYPALTISARLRR